MEKLVNKLLLAGGKYLPKLHLREPEFIYSAFVSFTKHCEGIETISKRL